MGVWVKNTAMIEKKEKKHKGEVRLENVWMGDCQNINHKKVDVFCEERARPISGGSPPCRNSLRFALFLFLFSII